ncbi:uncharacterized [Tachysurus ichikawai]
MAMAHQPEQNHPWLVVPKLGQKVQDDQIKHLTARINALTSMGDRTVHTVSSVERMDTVQWGAYNNLSGREKGASHCKGRTSDHTANAPVRHYSPEAGQA